MNESSDDFWIKVLLWGGGGLLALMFLGGVFGLITTILSFPFRHPWAFLAFGGIAYYLYRRNKQNQPSERFDETDDFEEIDEDIYKDY